MDYLIHLAILAAVYLVLVWSLDLLVGRLGVFSLCQAALVGVGAYTYTLFRQKLNSDPWLALALAGVTASLVGLTIAKLIGRLRAEQAMLFTLAFQGLASTLFYNLEYFTGGAYGVAGIVPPFVLGDTSASLANHGVLAAAVLVLGAAFFSALHRSAPGLAMRAVGEDEALVQSYGVSVQRVRNMAFAFTGATAGIAGSVLAGYLSFIDPTSFGLNESIFLLTALLVGGTGNLLGPATGVALVLLLPEVLRALALSPSMAGNVQKIAFAVCLIILMRLRPQGVAGEVPIR